jgi:fructose-1,6-bisphosphatase/sedoheptulose 1,7-bisphosphatase-like protein
MLRGVRVEGHYAYTHSIVMRLRSRTVRYITARHDLTRKTIQLSSEQGELRV